MNMDPKPPSVELEKNAEAIIRKQWDEVVMPHVDESLHELASNTLDKIIELYSDEEREHHGLEHIAYCLEKLEAYKGRDEFLTLWFALLLHDVVYDTHNDMNEEDSGGFAGKVSDTLGLGIGDNANRLIVSTKKHDSEVEDEALVCSIDMMILAEDSERYDQYSREIRAEYEWVPIEIYKRERIKVLQGFGKIFRHPDFEEYEEKAQRNIDREIEELSV